jgi:hypothetical protein
MLVKNSARGVHVGVLRGGEYWRWGKIYITDKCDNYFRVNIKTEDVKFKVDRQNKDMSRILGKK